MRLSFCLSCQNEVETRVSSCSQAMGNPVAHSKALTIYPRTLEQFATRRMSTCPLAARA